jgi:hypothetical protein
VISRFPARFENFAMTSVQESKPPDKGRSQAETIDKQGTEKSANAPAPLRICAHLAGLLDFEQALARLLQSNFYVSDEVIASIRQDIARAEGAV